VLVAAVEAQLGGEGIERGFHLVGPVDRVRLASSDQLLDQAVGVVDVGPGRCRRRCRRRSSGRRLRPSVGQEPTGVQPAVEALDVAGQVQASMSKKSTWSVLLRRELTASPNRTTAVSLGV
jgi:hypothetical protein